jgi:hypothetical protein
MYARSHACTPSYTNGGGLKTRVKLHRGGVYRCLSAHVCRSLVQHDLFIGLVLKKGTGPWAMQFC